MLNNKIVVPCSILFGGNGSHKHNDVMWACQRLLSRTHFAESCYVVALGIDIDGIKHPLALVEGSAENATLVTELLVGLRDRSLDVTRPMFVGPTGPRPCARPSWPCSTTRSSNAAKCTRSETSKTILPQRLRSSVGRKMTDAHHADSALEAEAARLALAKELDRTRSGAAASLREGLDETLTRP